MIFRIHWFLSFLALLLSGADPQFASSQTDQPASQQIRSQQESTPASPQAQPEAQTPTVEKPSVSKPSKAATKKMLVRHKKSVHTNPPEQSGRVVVHRGGAVEVTAQLAPGMTQKQALQEREKTEQLLVLTDENLKKVEARQLTAAQQSTVATVRTYMRQSKVAADSGDITRARTLAYKAHLLTDDLIRH
jgi:hypothetical protein